MKTSRCSICLLFVLGVAQFLQAASISVTPSTQSVNLGDQAVVSLDISGLGTGSAPSVGVFDIDLSFDASILALNSVTVGDPVLGDQLDLFALGSILGVTPGAGTVNVFEISLDLPDDLNLLQADAFTLATFTFNTLAAGSSVLGLTLNALGDADGFPLEATLTGGSIDVVGQETPPVPTPEGSAWVTYALLLGVLAGSGAYSRQNQSALLPVSSKSRVRL